MRRAGIANATTTLASLLVACLAVFAPGSLAAAPPEVGDRVPDLSLRDLEGETYTLSERTGEGPAVLVFFRGAW